MATAACVQTAKAALHVEIQLSLLLCMQDTGLYIEDHQVKIRTQPRLCLLSPVHIMQYETFVVILLHDSSRFTIRHAL